VVDDKRKSDFAPKSARQPIKNWPVTERLREKLLQIGPEGLSDGELLAVLLRIGKSGQSAEDLGRQLISQFNGISGIDRVHADPKTVGGSVSGNGSHHQRTYKKNI
jgi:DNA repair protein RadC